MKRRLYRNKWFILACLVSLFFVLTSAKVALAGTDAQLDKILKAGLDALIAYLDWLKEILKLIW